MNKHAEAPFLTHYFQILSDIPLSTEQAEEISDIATKGDHLMLRKSMKLDDLKERDASSVVSVALPNEHSEEISDIASKGDQLTLRKSLSLDDLKDSYVPSVASLGSRAIGSNDLVLEGPIDIDSKKGQGKESRLSSAVKKMITAFESSSPQVLYSSQYCSLNSVHILENETLITLLRCQNGSQLYIYMCKIETRKNAQDLILTHLSFDCRLRIRSQG
jgi:hypothetical protein